MKDTNLSVHTGMMIGKATIYGTSWCPHCKHQKEAFENKHVPYNFIDCDKSPNKCQGIQGYPVVRDYPNKGDEWSGFKPI